MIKRRTPSFKRLLAEAIKDIIEGFGYWRVWMHLGMNDIRMRYKRSIIGQNWQTLSTAVFLVAILLIYSHLLKVDVSTFGVHLVCSYSCWLLISSMINESCNTFIGSEGRMRNYNFPLTVGVYQMIARDTVVFLHSLVLVIPTFLLLGHPFSWSIVLIVPVVLVYALNGVWIGIVLGVLCARFRDVPQAVGSAVQILFILTPVMYPIESVGGAQQTFVNANPFTQFLLLGRNVLMGKAVPEHSIIVVACVTIVGLALGVVVLALTRRKIIYWL